MLVPVKAFGDAKARLAGVLTADERARLAQWSATRVVGAAPGHRVVVACDSPDVADWASALGAEVLWCPGTGLDGAVATGVRHLASTGARHVVVAHSDLPLVRDASDRLVSNLAAIGEAGTVTLVPDGTDDGTNVLSMPTNCGLEPAYGPRSFHRHLSRALATGLPVRVLRHPALAHDLDVPHDLTHPLVQEVLPTWLPTSPASRTPR